MAAKYVYFFGNGQAEGNAQMKNLLGLKSLLTDYSHASQEKHFKIRARQRGFDLDLIPAMWNGMLWRPGDHDRWLVELAMKEQDLLWSLTVDFDESDRPRSLGPCGVGG